MKKVKKKFLSVLKRGPHRSKDSHFVDLVGGVCK